MENEIVPNMKKTVGFRVVEDLIRPGQTLGMGTGTTAYWAMVRIAQKLKSGELSDLTIVPTSSQTVVELQDLGIRVSSLNETGGQVDIAIDGADQVDPEFCLIKGGGAAQTLEKIVEYNAKTFFVIVDESKLVQRLGDGFPVPVEIIPEARVAVVRRLRELGIQSSLRLAVRKAGAVVSDNGNFILDAEFPGGMQNHLGKSPKEVESLIQQIPGVVEVGIFTRDVAGVYVGRPDGRVDVLTRG